MLGNPLASVRSHDGLFRGLRGLDANKLLVAILVHVGQLGRRLPRVPDHEVREVVLGHLERLGRRGHVLDDDLVGGIGVDPVCEGRDLDDVIGLLHLRDAVDRLVRVREALEAADLHLGHVRGRQVGVEAEAEVELVLAVVGHVHLEVDGLLAEDDCVEHLELLVPDLPGLLVIVQLQDNLKQHN